MISLLAALTIKVSAILLLALIGTLCLRRSSASARHWVLAVGVVSALAVPALHVLPMHTLWPRLSVPFTGRTDVGLLGAAVVSQPAGSPLDRFRSAVAALASDEMVGWLALTIWLVGAVASTGVLLAGLARLRWLRASSDRLRDGPWRRLCSDLARSRGLKRRVDLLLSPRPGLMATWGWRRPVIMLPAAASKWPVERMRVVLLHELAHACRGDWMLQMAAAALRCFWWFNPLAWMVCRRIRRESEHAADDLVLSHGVPPVTYATHLVELAREVRKSRQMWLPAPAMASRSYLKRRLSVMLNSQTNRRPITRLARFGSLSMLVPASILFASLEIRPASAAGAAESVGSAVEQEQPAEPASERIEELVARLAALQAALEAVLDELHATLDEPDRSADPPIDPIRVGDGISPPTRIHGVAPIYPPEAVTAGVEGIVVLKATIGPTGDVTDVEILRSVPLLDEAAVATVSEWRYAPMLVDGEPAGIQMTVNVDFTLPSPLREMRNDPPVRGAADAREVAPGLLTARSPS